MVQRMAQMVPTSILECKRLCVLYTSVQTPSESHKFTRFNFNFWTILVVLYINMPTEKVVTDDGPNHDHSWTLGV